MLGNFQASTTVAAMVPPHVMKAATVSRRVMRATAVGEAVDPMGGLLGFWRIKRAMGHTGLTGEEDEDLRKPFTSLLSKLFHFHMKRENLIMLKFLYILILRIHS